MRRNAIVCLISALALCTSFAVAEEFQVMFYDNTGTLIENIPASVSDANGQVLQKLAPAADGVYTINADRGQKLLFRVEDPSLGNLNKQEFRMPLEIVGPIAIDLPGESPTPQQVPANDECANATAIVAPSVTAGTTLGATFEPFPAIPDCPTPGGVITAPGVWFSTTGTGNTMTASTCELNSPGSSDYDTKITIYCKGCDPATCVNSNDDTDDGGFCGFTFHSTVSWGSQPVTYGILVHGFASSVGNFNLSLADDGVPAAPTVDCLPPPVTGACCVQECFDPAFGHCEQATADDCAAAGGEYQGDDTPCATPTGNSSTWSSSPNVLIPDNNAAGVQDQIAVGSGFSVVDVTVDVIISHTWINDLAIKVTSPTGKTTNMWDRRCGNTDNIDFNWSDAGTDSLCSVVAAPGTGSGMPTVSGLGPALAQFQGDDASGNWEISVDDNFGADSGTLHFWALNFEEGAPTCVFPSCGDGIVQGDEQCDDGNNVDGDGCSAVCITEAVDDEDEDGDWWGSIEGDSGTAPDPSGVFDLRMHTNANTNAPSGEGQGGSVPDQERQRLGSRLPRR